MANFICGIIADFVDSLTLFNWQGFLGEVMSTVTPVHNVSIDASKIDERALEPLMSNFSQSGRIGFFYQYASHIRGLVSFIVQGFYALSILNGGEILFKEQLLD